MGFFKVSVLQVCCQRREVERNHDKMPKSKRNKFVSLSKTTSKGMEMKKELVEKIKSSVDEFAYVYIFSVENRRNSKIKDIRNEWKSSRFFFGKNKVMGIA